MARPRIDANARRSRQFGIRLTPAEAGVIEAAAARAGPTARGLHPLGGAGRGRHGSPTRRAGPNRGDGHPAGAAAHRRELEPGAPARACRPRYRPRRRGRRRARRRRAEAGVIPRIHAGGRGVRGLVAYITHDPSSADERQPTTDERVGLVAGLNLPTDDPHLASLIMARTAADAEAIKELAGTSSRGREAEGAVQPSVAVVVSGRAAPRPRRDAPGGGSGAQVDRHARVPGTPRRAHRRRASARTRGRLSRGPGDREGLRAEERRQETLDLGGEVRAQPRAGPGAEPYRAGPGPRGVPRSRRCPGRRRRPGRRGEHEGARRGSAAPDAGEARRGPGGPDTGGAAGVDGALQGPGPDPGRHRTRRGASGCSWPARIGGAEGGSRSSRRSRN